ncbi:MAG: aspartate kinase [Muribaculaceae bacterium]|nr:aspartate kinase [Muribaculaceae bacterium]
MKVLKFGGTSVGSVESLLNVKKITESIDGDTVIVVSALGGLTDRLIATARMAADGDDNYRLEMEAISSRHFNIISNVVDDSKRARVISVVSGLLAELKRNYDGVFLLRDLPSRTLDTIVSFGERMSSVIVGAMIDGASLHDSMEFIKTEKWFSKDIADQKLTSRLIREEFKGFSGKAVCPGFISTDKKSGEITNLGRGGSDFSAALIAAALNADVLEIWTDVDGFMTADPRIIPESIVVSHMTFVESMELCSFGAKVIYPPTIYPVFHKNIPIRILNTFNPSAPGTLITDIAMPDDLEIKGISAIRGTSLFSLSGKAAQNTPMINSRTFNAMARMGIKVFLVSGPDGAHEFTFAVSDTDADNALHTLKSEFAPELANGSLAEPLHTDRLATVAVVGVNMRSRNRLSARIINTLRRNSIDVAAFSYGVSDTTISFVVPLDETDHALRLIHSLIY